MQPPYKIFSLGDQAVSLDLGNVIDEGLNRKVLAMKQWIGERAPAGLTDLVVAYSSLTVYFDPVLLRKNNPVSSTCFEFIGQLLQNAFEQAMPLMETDAKVFRIPACYAEELGPDTEWVCREKNISREELIGLHTGSLYRVYMVGFLPGFCYLGNLDERLIVPRKHRPVPVEAGSVGIAGSQTGAYPISCPGGWQIIARTPLKLFDRAAALPVPIKIGDLVGFYEIGREEFSVLRNEQSAVAAKDA